MVEDGVLQAEVALQGQYLRRRMTKTADIYGRIATPAARGRTEWRMLGSSRRLKTMSHRKT
jgi:hypothetical protein